MPLTITYSPDRLDHGKIGCEVKPNSLDFFLQNADVNGEGHHGDVISSITISLSGEAVAEIIKRVKESED